MTKFTKFLVGAVVAVAVFASSASASYTHTGVLKMGMTSSQVQSLQKTLNGGGFLISTTGAGSPGMESMYFGAKTKAAVMSFQVAKGLMADGVVGAQTGTALAAMTGGSVSFPAGCSSTTGFSTTTGQPCTSTASTTLPAGCVAGAMFSSTTGASCTGGSTTTGPLTGGAGDLDLDETSTDVETTVEEGTTEKVYGIEASADDSDIAITNVKVELHAVSGSYSTRLEKYAETVSVWLGDKKVGEVDADEFSKDGTTYTKSISLSGAVVKEDDEENLYIGFTALDSVDDDAQTFNVTVTDVRYSDATGAILTADTAGLTGVFGFEEEGAEDEIAVKSASSNPDATTLKVDEDTKSDDFMVLSFNLDVDEDSSDITVNELPIHFSISTGTFATVINEVYVKVGSTEYDADRDAAASATSGTYTVDFNDDFVIDSGDMEEVKVYVVFNKQDGNYSTGATITASVSGGNIDAEGVDEVTVTGSASGKTHTLEVDAPMFDLTSKSFALSQSIDGVTTGTEDIFLAKFEFEVTADDDDVYLPFSTTSGSGSVQYTITGGATVDSVVLDSDDSDIEETNSYKVDAGSTEKFTLSFYVRGNNAANKIEIVGFGTAISDATTRSDLITSGLTDFKTNSVYLAK